MAAEETKPHPPSTTEIRDLLRDDAIEKKSYRYQAPVSKKRPRDVVFPSDRIDKRSHPDYRSGPVFSRQFTPEEVLTNLLEKLPHARALHDMDPDQRRELLQPLVDRMKNKELAEALDLKVGTLSSYLSTWGITRSNRKQTTPQKVKEENTMEKGFQLILRGDYTAEEVSKKLLSLASLLGDGSLVDGRFHISLEIKEQPAPELGARQ